MELAVLGGGNGAYATAADLALRGHSVRMWRRDIRAFRPVLDDKIIVLTDADGTHHAEIALPTDRLVEAVAGAEVVIAPLPAFAQKELAAELAPILEDGQLVVLTPGSFGSYVMASELHQLGCGAEVTFAESATLPYLARKLGAREVGVTGRATTLPFGVYPGRVAGTVVRQLRSIFPGATVVEDALDAAMLNAGPIIHPPLVILNAPALERSATYDIHSDGTQPCTRAVQEALDSERMSVRLQLGYQAPHFPLRDYYEGRRWFYENGSREQLVDSNYWRERVDLRTHRYVTEDIFFGLAFMVSVAAWAGVDVPVGRGLLSITSSIVGRDLHEAGRTLASAGLASLRAAEVRDLLKEGGLSETPFERGRLK